MCRAYRSKVAYDTLDSSLRIIVRTLASYNLDTEVRERSSPCRLPTAHSPALNPLLLQCTEQNATKDAQQDVKSYNVVLQLARALLVLA